MKLITQKISIEIRLIPGTGGYDAIIKHGYRKWYIDAVEEETFQFQQSSVSCMRKELNRILGTFVE